MITISALLAGGWAAVPAVLMWALVVLGVTKVVFRSFFAAELLSWLRRRNNERLDEMKRLQWELRSNTTFRPGITKDDMTHLPPLSDEERAERLKRIEELQKNTLGVRALSYLLTCELCQSMESAFVVALLTLGFCWELVPTAIAYGALASLVLDRAGKSEVPARAERTALPGKRCGS